MTTQVPSFSAVGSHLDEEVEIAILARKYYEEEGCPEGRALDHWVRAEHEIRGRHEPAPSGHPADPDAQVEEAMHLDL